MREKEPFIAEYEGAWSGGGEQARAEAEKIRAQAAALLRYLHQTPPYMRARTKTGDTELTFKTKNENTRILQRIPASDRRTALIEVRDTNQNQVVKQWEMHTDEQQRLRRLTVMEIDTEGKVPLRKENAFQFDERGETVSATETTRHAGTGETLEFLDYLAPERTQLSESTLQALDDASNEFIRKHYELAQLLQHTPMTEPERLRALQKHMRDHYSELTAWDDTNFEKIIGDFRVDDLFAKDAVEPTEDDDDLLIK